MGYTTILTNKECANLLEQMARTLSEPMRTQAIQACDRLRYTANEEPEQGRKEPRQIQAPAQTGRCTRFSIFDATGKRVLVSVPED